MNKNKKVSKKRVTKKDVYKSFEIDYNPKTQKIFVPFLNIEMREPLKPGNTKVGKDVAAYSMQAGNMAMSDNIIDMILENASEELKSIPYCTLKTLCGGTCGLRCAHCYALNGKYKTDTVKLCMARHALLARLQLDFLERAIKAQLTCSHFKMCRIHIAGDFISVQYVQMWERIVKMFPGIDFWTYTKQYGKSVEMDNALNQLDSHENMNIVSSFVGNALNFGTCEHVMKLYYMLKSMNVPVYICKCGIDKEMHCNKCKHCSKFKYVLFLEHGNPKYNPKKDPLYPEFCKLVESQPDTI